MTNLHFQNPSTIEWLQLLRNVVNLGIQSSPRGHETRELLGQHSSFNMLYPIVLVKERKLGYKFMAAEAAWILSGDNRVKTISPYSKEIANFSDDGEVFFGAYGPRVRDQLLHVTRTLAKDINSRQAVITIWRQNPPESKDIPCTISVQWIVRNGFINCFVNMRSSDVWLGVPYDWFNFTCLTMGITLMLRKYDIFVDLGTLHFYAASQHLYLSNLQAAEGVLALERHYSQEFQGSKISPGRYRDFDDLVNSLWNCAMTGVLVESFT